MNPNTHNQIIALAGVFQSAALVEQIASSGQADPQAAGTSLRSLFVTDPEDVASVFGETSGICLGLGCLEDSLTLTGSRRAPRQTGYAMSLLHLSGLLLKQPQKLQAIADGLKIAEEQSSHFGLEHANVMARLADIYQSTISTLGPRILIKGEPLHLENSENASRVRALLLAGIRSAVLWRQCGGSRLGLVFRRRAILQGARELAGQACRE